VNFNVDVQVGWEIASYVRAARAACMSQMMSGARNLKRQNPQICLPWFVLSFILVRVGQESACLENLAFGHSSCSPMRGAHTIIDAAYLHRSSTCLTNFAIRTGLASH
jgi:hypothetical protein